jgi:hypothetical protein
MAVRPINQFFDAPRKAICLVCRANYRVLRFPVASSARPIRTTALAQTPTMRFTRDDAVRNRPKNRERQGGQDMTTTPVPIPEMRQFFTAPEGASARRQDAEPIEEPVLADAEEEEFAELWAYDRGNQGA